jgi:hypothetical protein
MFSRGSYGSRLNLFPLENQFAVFNRDLDFISRLEFAFQQAQGQRVEDAVLHGALERVSLIKQASLKVILLE